MSAGSPLDGFGTFYVGIYFGCTMTYVEEEVLTGYILTYYSRFISLQNKTKLRPGYPDDYSRTVFARELAKHIPGGT